MVRASLRRFGALLLAALASAAGHAATPVCDAASQWPVSALRQLPYPVQLQLIDDARCASRTPNQELVVVPALLMDETAPATGGGFGACIADPGQPFRAGDVVLAPDVPTTRLVSARASAHCIEVTLKHGGRAYHAEVLTFIEQPDAWRLVARRPAGHPLASLPH